MRFVVDELAPEEVFLPSLFGVAFLISIPPFRPTHLSPPAEGRQRSITYFFQLEPSSLTRHRVGYRVKKFGYVLMKQIKVMLRPTVSRPVCLGVKPPPGTQNQLLNTVSYWCGTTSVKRGRVCCLQLPLVFASVVIGTHDHILLSQIRDTPDLESQFRVFISPRNRVAQLYPQALCSLFVASYDSQCGGIRTRLHARISEVRGFRLSDI
jgi:hypothetical protein